MARVVEGVPVGEGIGDEDSGADVSSGSESAGQRFYECDAHRVGTDVAGHVLPRLPQGCSGGAWRLKEARPARFVVHTRRGRYPARERIFLISTDLSPCDSHPSEPFEVTKQLASELVRETGIDGVGVAVFATESTRDLVYASDGVAGAPYRHG